MIRDVNVTYSGQYVKNMLEARREAVAKGEEFDLKEFKIQLPRVGGDDLKLGKSDKQTNYVMEYLGNENVLNKIRSFDTDHDGKIGFSEHCRMLEFEANTQSVAPPSNLDQKGLHQLLNGDMGLDVPEEMIEVYFNKFDLDNDGMLNPEELEKAIQYIVEEIERKLEQERESKENVRRARVLSESDFVPTMSTPSNGMEAKARYEQTLESNVKERKFTTSA